MAILQDDDVRFRNLSRKIGIFLLVAVVGIVATLATIGVRQELFTPKARIYFLTGSGRDINQGMAVKLSGFRIGHVRQLSLTEQAAVRVSLEINREYMQWIRKDSRARLLKEGVIGDSVIEISPGSEGSPELAHLDSIVFEREVGMGELLDQLSGDIRPLLADLRQLVQSANAVVAGLPATREKLDGVLDSLPATRAKLDTVLDALPATQEKLDAVLASAQRNFENLEKLTADELPAVVRDGRKVVQESGKVVDALGRTWPISGGVEQSKPGVVPLDSAGAKPVAPAQ